MMHSLISFKSAALCCAALLALASPLFAQQMQYPLDVAAGEGGALFVADRDMHGIWKIEGGKLSPYFEGSNKFRTPLNAVRCVTFDKDGKLLAGDSATREVYRFDDKGQPVPLTDGGIGIPMSIGVSSSGELFVADLELKIIWKVPAAGGKPTQFASVPAPRGIFVDSKDQIWVLSHGKDQVLRIAPDGKMLDPAVKGQPFQFPHEVVVAPNGTAYVSDGYGKTIWKFTEGAAPEPLLKGEPLVNPVGIALDGEDVLVADPHAKVIFRIDPQGKIKSREPAAASE